MILADKIMEERKRNGWSQEELANQLGVSRQSVSKWESAQSVPDLNRILQMAELFGVTTDYLLKDEIEVREGSVADNGFKESADTSKTLRKVSMEEASEFLKVQEKNAPFIAFGASLCILAAAVLVILSGLAEGKLLAIPKALAEGVGLCVLLVMVAIAVVIFIKCGTTGEKFDYLNTREIETAYGVIGMVREKKQAFAGKYNTCICIGVVLCIFSVIPLIFSSFVTDKDYVLILMAGVLLIIVSIAVNIIIRVGIIQAGYDKLLQEKDYTVERKKVASKSERISGIYWPIVVAVYLGGSLLTKRWDVTWIIWPVAGILYGVVASIARVSGEKED